jgi:nitroimidazol reductase NimA-like FMN-containing flavoprotein (pyridoxamine 5'-phosphate oxidase superfamily)
MRRKDREITDKEIIEEILSKSDICRIAIQDDDIPYLVPLNYGYNNGALYFHSASRGRKIELLKRNNRVAFEIEYSSEIIKEDIPCKWSSKYRSVMGTGTIEILQDGKQIRDGLDIIMTHYGHAQNTYDEAYFSRIVILKLTIENISGKQSGEWG